MVKLRLNLPWNPILSWPWGVEYTVDPDTFLITKHKESWDVEALDVRPRSSALRNSIFFRVYIFLCSLETYFECRASRNFFDRGRGFRSKRNMLSMNEKQYKIHMMKDVFSKLLLMDRMKDSVPVLFSCVRNHPNEALFGSRFLNFIYV